MKKTVARFFLYLLLAVVFLGAIVFFIFLGNGGGLSGMAQDLLDLYARSFGRYVGPGRITMETWPSYDPDAALDPAADVTGEDIARYLAAKLPDGCKNEETLFYDIKIFDAVLVSENPAYGGEINTERPLREPEALRFEAAVTGVDARVVLSFAAGREDTYPETDITEVYQAVLRDLLAAFPAGSGFAWRRLVLTVAVEGSGAVDGTAGQWQTIPLEEYMEVFPTYGEGH